MRKKELILIVTLLIVIVGANIGSASFNLHNVSLEKKYSAGSLVKGSFNISFSNEDNKNFTSNFDSSIGLFDILKKSGFSAGIDFRCNPENCKEGYDYSNPAGTNSFNLDSDKTFGFVLEGEDVEIRDFSIKIASNVASTCSVNQLSIDLFDEGERDFYNNKYLNVACGDKNYGCFNTANINGKQKINSIPYCQNMSLLASPAYKVGAKVNKTATGGKLVMEMYDSSDERFLGKCDMPTGILGEQEIDCIINYSAKTSFDALVCIKDELNSEVYRINRETTNPCGMFGVDVAQTPSADYEIYAQRLKYDKVEITLNKTLYSSLNIGENLVDDLQDYLDERYGSNCEPSCVIPLKFSGVSQEVNISSVKLDYISNIGSVEENELYKLVKSAFKISFDFLKFDIEKFKISVPNKVGIEDFRLSFDGREIFEKEINITSDFQFEIMPTFSILGQDTMFGVVLNKTINSSTWNFGDGTIVSSNNGNATHKYLKKGEYEVIVTLTDRLGEGSTKKFIVTAGNPKDSANLTLKRYTQRLSNLTADIKKFPDWVGQEIGRRFSVVDLNNSVERLKKDFEVATTDEEYVKVVVSLSNLNIPTGLGISESGELPLDIGLNNIDVSYIEEVSSRQSSNEAELSESIRAWISENLDVDISFETISTFGEKGTEDLLTKFTIKITDKSEGSDQKYLFIDLPIEEIKFRTSQGEKTIGGGAATYLAVIGNSEIEAIVPGKVSVQGLGAYISPDISKLSSIEEVLPPEEPKFKTTGFLIWISILIASVLVVYIVLQEWYKRHYESYLFRNKDDLYNTVNFIYNGRRAGLGDGDIRNKLKNAGWGGEQINYAFKKIDGKRTGMFEIPIFKFVENRRVEREIQKRQGQSAKIDARFIKQTRY